MPNLIGTEPNQIPTNSMLGKKAYMDFDGFLTYGTSATTIASASTIQPTTPVTFVSGVVTISNIIVPPEILGSGQITIIPTGLWSTNTSGNIAIATTAITNRALIMTYDSGTNKWYPSY